MAVPAAHRPANGAEDQSLGDLVSLAVNDMSQLIRCELDLAKLELKSDLRRVGLGGVLICVAAFVGCLVLMLLSFAFAYGLITLGIWDWAAFLIVAGVYLLLAGLAVLIAYTRVRNISGFSKTRRSVQEGLALIQREDGAAAGAAARTG
jgi:hypothetical protein